ncbi:MAG TPA: WD40 repeat domain-containing protein, partial [Gemmataceae bacterium]|nr:WD40 repeat domain-containing protein [Gemmataceae bacterium]
GPLRLVIGGATPEVSGLAFSPNGKTLASVLTEFAQQNTTTYLRLSSTADGKEIRKIEAAGGVSSITFSPDGKRIAFGSSTSIVVMDADPDKEIRTLKNGPSTIASLVFSPDSKILAAKGHDQKVRLWDANSGEVLHELGSAVPMQGGGGNAFVLGGFFGAAEIRDLAFSRDSKFIAVGGAQAPRFYNVGTGKEQTPAGGGHKAGVSSLLLAPDSKTMLSSGADHVIRRWNASTGEEISQFTHPDGTVAVAFSPDAKTIALANIDGTIRLHSADSGKELHKVKAHQNGVAAIVFSANSKLLASRGTADNKINIFDVDTGRQRQSILIPPDGPAMPGGFGAVRNAFSHGLAFSPDGAHIASTIGSAFRQNVIVNGQLQTIEATSTIRTWDVATGKALREIKLPSQRSVAAIVYSPDGRLIASDNNDQTVSLWELASGRERVRMGEAHLGNLASNPPAMDGVVILGGRRLLMTSQTLPSIAFAPDGERIATRFGNDVKVWDPWHAKEIANFKGHSGPVGPVVFAPDGRSAASGSVDTTILVWDLTRIKRELLAPISLRDEQLKSLWNDLGGSDAMKAGEAVRKLAAGAKDAIPFLSKEIKPAAAIDPKKIDQWIMDLDSSNFQKRTRAAAELEKIGELARPALKKVLDSEPSPEMRRRVEPMLDKLVTGTLTAEQVRVARVIEALEKSGSAEARQFLQTLAQGAPGAFTTREAQDTLARLKTRS